MLTIMMEWAPATIGAFIRDAAAYLEARGPASVLDLHRPFTELFGRTETLAQLANAYLQRVIDGEADAGDPVLNIDILILCHAPALSLRIVKDRSDVPSFGARPSQAGIVNAFVNHPANTLIHVVAKRPIHVQWYCLESGADFDVFDATLKIRADGSERLAGGSTLYVDARKRFPVLPPDAEATYVVLSGACVNSQVVSFDPASLRPLGASMASEHHSVLGVMLGLLDARQGAYPLQAVLELARHPDHHVRWAAATALGKHDRMTALDVIRHLAAHDGHKFIRDAACRTLREALQ